MNYRRRFQEMAAPAGLAFSVLTAPLAAAASTPALDAASGARAGSLPLLLAPLVVTASRAPQPAGTLAVAADVLSADDLHASPSLAIDDALRSIPAFSLFRRSGSLTANPTAQGVSLRGLGPSGASRSLVLLDGVPLNDPFGGWVAWTKVPRLSLSAIEIVRGGGSGAWGNAALGGTVQLLTDAPGATAASAGPPGPPAARAVIEAAGGDFSTFGGELLFTGTPGTSVAGAADNRFLSLRSVSLDAAAFTTGGVYLVRHPGSIDRPADLDYQRAQASVRTTLAGSADLVVTARAYAEDRGNGTPLQRNASHETFLAATLTNRPAAGAVATGGQPDYSLSLYFQKQSFESFFSSVSADRTTETPASDQYDVPATAAGAAFTATWGGPEDDARFTAGADLRYVEGETREDYLYSAPLGDFTRRRFAGGEQVFAGGFARYEYRFAPRWRGSLGARVDYWTNRDGHRREWDTTAPASAPLRDDRYSAADGVEFSPDAGLVWQAAQHLRVRGSVYQAFRVPTLNEYYRPFRVGPVTTEANPELSPETLTGGELGLDLGDERAGAALTLFVNELEDAVTNVTVAPDTRQRRNLDRVRVQGLEASVHARPHPSLYLKAGYLFSDARVTDPGAGATELDGKRLAQVPRHTLSASLRWTAPGALEVNARLRWFSDQYEDDENTLRLAAATVVDLGLSRRFGRDLEVFVAVENCFDTEVQTGRTAAGVVSVGPPRQARAGVRWNW
ncbi:outer membrane receptor for ferrienterochelin and colicins [Opitutaceae bacterium TAV1]|nr:outer membrane receptor for ferrienterochelin and colicins [Opitutaceae bacterium TAV1]